MDINSLMNQARQFQEKMTVIQDELGRKSVTSSVGGGLVQATVSGKMELISLEIGREAIDPNEAAMLQDLVVSAVNDALRKAQDMARQEMRQLTGGFNLPGLF